MLRRVFRLPRPKTFLYFMSLRTGTELSTLVLLLNKVSGVYGILALLTGLHLSTLQLSMYLYSIVALGLLLTLAPHIRTQRPFECLALGTFFVVDSLINALWTVAFAITWFLVISDSHHQSDGVNGAGSTMAGAAGFTTPQYNVSKVDVMVGPDQGIPGTHNEAVTAGSNANTAASSSMSSSSSTPSLGHGMLQPESLTSIIIICGLWIIRAYLTLVVCSYVRLVLRRHIAQLSATHSTSSKSHPSTNLSKDPTSHSAASGSSGPSAQATSSSIPLSSSLSPPLTPCGSSAASLENPFAEQYPGGIGWRGRLGRVMIRLGRFYWLKNDPSDNDWMTNDIPLNNIRRSRHVLPADEMGVIERERRRRSGTGPPPAPTMPQIQTSQGRYLRVQEIRDGK